MYTDAELVKLHLGLRKQAEGAWYDSIKKDVHNIAPAVTGGTIGYMTARPGDEAVNTLIGVGGSIASKAMGQSPYLGAVLAPVARTLYLHATEPDHHEAHHYAG